MVRLWTILLISGAVACCVAWVVLALREKGLSSLQGVRRTFRGHPKYGRAVLGFVFCGLFILCATKPQAGGNGEQGSGDGGTNGVQMVGGGLEGNANVANVEMLPITNTTVQWEGSAQLGNGDIGTGILHSTFYILHSNGVPVVAGTISAEDCEAGYVLSAVRTGETHSFEPPPDAVVCEDWLTFGAARDWFSLPLGCWALGSWLGGKVSVNSCGLVETLPGLTNGWIAPLAADLGIVPEANWQQILHFTPYTLHSLFWHCLTPSNTLQMTWVNALLDRAATNPVSFQCEVAANGDVEFRYDLSALADDVISNVTVGVSCGGGARCLGQLSKSVTSLRFARIDPFDAVLTDRDGDGISTVDEVFLHHTDPGNPDTDFDGLTDYEELFVWNTAPTNPHTLRPDMPDGMAVRIGGENPWACPEGSTNTIWEHVFYSGTTNGAFAYPQPDDATAVLAVTVSGEGSGELVVGGTVVPLLAPPQMRSGGVASSTLYVRMVKGVTYPVHLRKDGTLDLTVTSDDFAFGILPSASAGVWSGRINFPNTEAPEVCVHHLETRTVAVSLPMSADAEALTCEWTGGDGVEAHNHPPRSATLEGDFSPSAGATFPYHLDHPEYRFGAKSYEQRVRFCPRPEYDPGENEGDVLHCGCVAGCSCGGECEPGQCMCDDPTVSGNPEYCAVHGMPLYECEHLHGEDDEPDYDEASLLPQMMGVLPLRVPTYHARTLHIDVPFGDYTPCCPCPEHAANHTDAAFVSHRLSVLTAGGLPFRTATVPCDVAVGGVAPSCVVGDAQLLLATNGAVSADLRYTVFGVGISAADGVDLAALNAFAPAFGLPVAPGTNAPAANLSLDLNVRLTQGRVRLSFVNPNGRFLVMAEIGAEGSRHWSVIADSETRPVLDMSITAWRRMFGRREGEDFSVPVAVMAAGTGKCDVKFTYWTVVDGEFAEDSAVQRITAVPPPMTIDYDRNGVRDTEDIRKCIDGNIAYFWKNDDRWKCDDAFASSDALNVSDDVVNGRNDLVNFLALAIDLKAFAANWGTDIVRYCLETDHGTTMSNAKISLSGLGWDEMDSVVLGTGTDVGGAPLHQASVARLGDGTNLPPSFVTLSQLDSGIVLMEFPDLSRYGRLYLNVYSKANDAKLFSSVINLHVGEAEHMVAWENIRGAAGGTGGVPTRHNTQDWPPEAHQPGNVVFVHGYNMHEGSETKQWAINVFKKLWWAGLDRGFVAVQWRGNEGQLIGTDITPNYYGNVLNAFASAGALKTAMDGFTGPKWFLAHSLGNMLVSAAIQDCGMPYERYFMLNAAVAMEAFDAASGVTQESHDNMTPGDWTQYADRVRSTHWWELFPVDDGRRTLTWKGRFTNVTNIVNFYSSEDEVVCNGDGIPKDIGREYAWYNQETRKGLWPFMLHEYEGGWAFNSYYDLPTYTWVGDQQIVGSRPLTPAETDNLTDGDLRQHPFFLGFSNSEMCSSTNGALVATNYLYRAEMLAYAIPAESYAVGSNPLSSQFSGAENFNMAALFTDGKDDLPANGINSDEKYRDWQHSTFVQRSFKRTRQLYQKIIAIIQGGLEQ